MIDTDKYEGRTPGHWSVTSIRDGSIPWNTADEELCADAPLLLAEVERMREALLTLRNDCQMILDGDDMSGMSDRELFGAMKATVLVGLGDEEE